MRRLLSEHAFGKSTPFTSLPAQLKETGQKQDKHKEFLGRAQTARLLPPDKKDALAAGDPQLPALSGLRGRPAIIYFLLSTETVDNPESGAATGSCDIPHL